MAGSLVADVNETGALARQLRFYTEGTVVAVDAIAHVARVDVQATLPDTTRVYLENVPYPSPQAPPPINAKVRLAYTNPDPHSVYIAGVGMPGQIQNKDLTIIGAVVNSLNAIGSPQLIGAVQIAAGSGLSISQVSQTITLSNAGVISLNALVGAVNLIAGTGIGLSISGQNITINNTLSAGMTNPMTAVGDIIVGGTAGAPTRLGIGTNGQVLGVNSGAVAWINNPAGFTNPMTTLGDIIIGGTAGAAARLGIGSTNQVLTVISGSPAWANPAGFTNPMTTSQDIIVGGASGTAGRLGIGANGQVLGVSAGNVAWINNPAGFTNPMTAVGDIIIGGTAGAAQRLGIGAAGQILTVISGSPAWANLSANTTVITSTGATLSNGPVNTVFAKISTAQTVTLQTNPNAGDILYIKNSANSSASITVAGNTIPIETGTVAAGKGYIMMVMAYNDVANTATNKWYTIGQF